jgi:methionyl-tRNA formyltransferase
LPDHKGKKKIDAGAGKIVRADKEGLVVEAGQNTLLIITRLQPEGKRVMSAWEYIQGIRIGDDWQWTSEKDKGR